MAVAATGAVVFYGPAWLLVPALAWLLLLGWWLWHGQVRGELLMQPEPRGGWEWSWRPVPGAEALPVRLGCYYLGPWLIALKIDGRRIWLWPDSAPPESLRQLRRALMR